MAMLPVDFNPKSLDHGTIDAVPVTLADGWRPVYDAAADLGVGVTPLPRLDLDDVDPSDKTEEAWADLIEDMAYDSLEIEISHASTGVDCAVPLASFLRGEFPGWDIGVTCGDELDDVVEDARLSLEPVMNYAYPVDGMTEGEAARFNLEHGAARNVSACLMPGGGYGFALTGGGMDMTWAIIEAFVVAGYLPPHHFCRALPNMAGHAPDPRILAAIRRTLDVRAFRASNALQDFDRRYPAPVDSTAD